MSDIIADAIRKNMLNTTDPYGANYKTVDPMVAADAVRAALRALSYPSSHPCPICSASAGEPCVTSEGKSRVVGHPDRRWFAEDALLAAIK